MPEQRLIDEALLIELHRALDLQSAELDALDRKAGVLLSTAGIMATILLALLALWFSDLSTEPKICPFAFVFGLFLLVAVVGMAIWALWVRPFWRPIYVALKDIEEYRLLDLDDLTGQILSQYIAAHERNQDTKNDKICKVKTASVVLFVGVLYLMVLAAYIVLTS